MAAPHIPVALLALTGFAVLAAPAGGRADPPRTLAPITLTDQHDAAHGVSETTAALLVSRDMDAGDVVKAALAGVDQGFLDARRLVYLADISGMPAFVSRMMAIPRMRSRGYRILLDREGELAKSLPGEKGRATLLLLDRLVVTGVEHFGDGTALHARLEALPARARP